LNDIRSLYFARNDVILEDDDELVLLLRLEQSLDGALGQLRKSFIDRRKDREWAGTLQSVNESTSLESCCQSFERAGRNGRIDDVLAGTGRFPSRCGNCEIGHQGYDREKSETMHKSPLNLIVGQHVCGNAAATKG